MTDRWHGRAHHVAEITADLLVAGKLWVVVFGPGHGEAIVVRLPDGRVGVVDGCREPEDECPVARLLGGLKPPRLFFVCMTHPHEDHYKGLGRLLREYSGRVDHVWHALALTDHERLVLLKHAKRYYAKARGVSCPDAEAMNGLDSALRGIVDASQHHASPARRRQLVAERPLVFEDVGGSAFEVEAWGPSDDDTFDVIARFFTKGPTDTTKQRDLPNKVSGALLVRWGTSRVLLAGDLFVDKDKRQYRGWSPVLDRARHHRPVQVVNVAHHASENAHDGALWGAMTPSLAIVTPFQNACLLEGRPCQPPKPDELSRYLTPSCEVVVTARPAWLSVEGTSPRPTRPQATATIVRSPVQSSKLMDASAAPQPLDARHGVAVAMDHDGNIVDVILAGDADFYA